MNLEHIKQKFKSGNEIPVPGAYVTQEEFQFLLSKLHAPVADERKPVGYVHPDTLAQLAFPMTPYREVPLYRVHRPHVEFEAKRPAGLVPIYTAPPAALASAPVAEDAKDQIEHLDMDNHRLRRAMQKLMARLADLLDEDQFANCESIVTAAGVEPPESNCIVDELTSVKANASPVHPGFHSAPVAGEAAYWLIYQDYDHKVLRFAPGAEGKPVIDDLDSRTRWICAAANQYKIKTGMDSATCAWMAASLLEELFNGDTSEDPIKAVDEDLTHYGE